MELSNWPVKTCNLQEVKGKISGFKALIVDSKIIPKFNLDLPNAYKDLLRFEYVT